MGYDQLKTENNNDWQACSTKLSALDDLYRSLDQAICQDAAISFEDFMHLALYHAQHGYYSQKVERVGKSGDFYTSVSVGPCFGFLLARRIQDIWQQMGQPDQFVITEVGANNGDLAHDLLSAITANAPSFFQILKYQIVEPLENRRLIQKARLKNFPAIEYHESLSELSPHQGVMLSNELLDAFPVKVIQFQQGSWLERCVTGKSGNYTWLNRPINCPRLTAFTQELGTDFPENYTTEFHHAVEVWLPEALSLITCGAWITLDYGHSHSDYYLPQRSDGTLRAFFQHRQSNDLLKNPGQQDLTADVNFTQVARIAQKLGWNIGLYLDQAHYLTAIASPWLLELEKNEEAASHPFLRQFQTLTHPAYLGTRFRALELHRTHNFSLAWAPPHLGIPRLFS